jgi:hypothetical protein
MLAQDPRVVIENPTTRSHNEGAKATRNEPAAIRNTLHFDKIRSLAAAESFDFRDMKVLMMGSMARYNIVDISALSENRSPACLDVSTESR